MPIVRQLFTRTRQISTTLRDVGRVREIVRILLAHGFGYLFRDVEVPGVGEVESDPAIDEARSRLPTPERALAVIQELGPTFVKLGQILSTRPDLVPPSFIAAFQQLQDRVDPVPFDQIQTQLLRSLGQEGLARFEHIDPEPLASASIAQVHRARLTTGEDVVVKVQRPSVKQVLFHDLEIVKGLTRVAVRNFPEAKLFDPVGIIEEIERSVRSECDFRTEANHLRRFTANFQGNPFVHIPILYRELSTAEVLTLEFIDGVKITHAREAGHDMAVLGRHYLDAAYQMLFKDGFFHGDLHPGNVLVRPDGVLVFIDFGMVGRLTPDMKDNCIDMVFALVRQDFRTIGRIFWEIGSKDEHVSYRAFETDVFDVVERHFVSTTASELQIGQFFKEITDGAVRHHIRMPTTYTMMFKAMVTTEGLVRMLVPDLDPVEIARPHVEVLVEQRYGQERMQQEMFYYLGGLSRIARRLPTALHELVTDLEERRLRIGVDLRLTPPLKEELRRTEDRRLVTAFSIGAMFTATMALPHHPAILAGLPLLSLIGYTGAVLGMVWLYMDNPRRD